MHDPNARRDFSKLPYCGMQAPAKWRIISVENLHAHKQWEINSYYDGIRWEPELFIVMLCGPDYYS